MKLFTHLAVALFGAGFVGAGQPSACPCCRPSAPVAKPACCSLAAAPAPTCCTAIAAANPQDVPKPADKASVDEAKIKANLAKLSDADRKLAETQRFCAVENDDRLGSMGVPVMVMLKDQPVFLCCKGCTKRATADADKTLAKVKELKAKYGEKK